MAFSILMVTPRIPFPLRDGGSIAMNQALQSYLEMGCEVSLLALNTSRHWVDESTLPTWYQQLKHFESVYVKTDINPLSAFFNLFTDKSYNVARFVNKQVEQSLSDLLKKNNFDFIQFESIYTAPYLKTAKNSSSAFCMCRVHNIEHHIWQNLTEHETSFLKKRYLKLLTARLKNYELDILKSFDLLLPISQKEMHYIEQENLNRCIYVPFGVDAQQQIPTQYTMDIATCFHIGSMDWAPNTEGVQWFLDEVWNKVITELPQVKFHMAGKKMPASFIAKPQPQVVVEGEIEDVTRFCMEKNIMVVPLLSGAGIRIKILEAMTLGKTIITTSVGAAGIGATHEHNILICDDASLFALTLIKCFQQPAWATQIGENAAVFVKEHFDKKTIYSSLCNNLTALLKPGL